MDDPVYQVELPDGMELTEGPVYTLEELLKRHGISHEMQRLADENIRLRKGYEALRVILERDDAPYSVRRDTMLKSISIILGVE